MLLNEILNHQQRETINEALDETLDPNFRGLLFNLPMGTGKTRIALVTVLNNMVANEQENPTLIIASKTLIIGWIAEIKKIDPEKKFFKYEILHRDYLKSGYPQWRPHTSTNLVLTTPQTAVTGYRSNEVESEYIEIVEDGPRKVNYYKSPREPLVEATNISRGADYLHTHQWSNLIIDESHNYSNINTRTSRALASLCADHRWLLTGTPLPEPKAERVLGLLQLVGQFSPESIPETVQMLRSHDFEGLRQISIKIAPVPLPNIEVNRETIRYQASYNELRIYDFFKFVTETWQEYYQLQRSFLGARDPHLAQIRGNLLSLLTYSRMALTTPTEALDRLLDKIKSASYLAGLHEEIEEMSVIVREITNQSSRILELQKLLDRHHDGSVLVFANYQHSLQTARDYLIEHYGDATDGDGDVRSDRNFYLLTANYSLSDRVKLIDEFNHDPTGVLFLSYQIGAEGLNLQHAQTVVLLDQYWNSHRQEQAFHRTYRQGGKHTHLNLYTVLSETRFEANLIGKHLEKSSLSDAILEGYDELEDSPYKTTSRFKTSFVEMLQRDGVDGDGDGDIEIDVDN